MLAGFSWTPLDRLPWVVQLNELVYKGSPQLRHMEQFPTAAVSSKGVGVKGTATY